MPKTALRAKGWWGPGKSPAKRYPGVTIEIPSVYSKKRERWESPDGRFYYDQDAADRHVEFFPTYLRLQAGKHATEPFELLDYAEWLIVRPVFGWKHTDSELRRFRTVMLAIPKGNAKSALASGLAIELTLIDGEHSAEVYAVAADRKQAAIVFDNARAMVEESADLDGDGIADLLTACRPYMRQIIVPQTKSKFEVRSADVKGSHGPNIHGLIFDEFHAQPNRKLYESLSRGTLKREQPLTVLLTTAGDDDESICAEEWERARKIQSGTIEDDSFLPVIFEASPDEDWQDERVWARVNPGMGRTFKLEDLRVEAAAAAAEPRKRNDFLRYRLNRWVNQAIAWLPIEWWDRCKIALPSDEILQGLPCAAGLDLSQKTDLSAFVALFREQLEGPAPEVQLTQATEEGEPAPARPASLNYRIYLVPFFWLPKDTLVERVKQDRVQYDIWAEQGLLSVTDGDVIDYDRIIGDITKRIGPRFNLIRGEIGYDPAFASDLAPKLAGAGYQMVEILQGYKQLSEPAQVFEALLKAGRVVHGGRNKLMRWNIENVAIKTDDSGRIRPVKPKRAAKRIDGVVAALMALNRLMIDARSVYEQEGRGLQYIEGL